MGIHLNLKEKTRETGPRPVSISLVSRITYETQLLSGLDMCQLSSFLGHNQKKKSRGKTELRNDSPHFCTQLAG